jgi:hypothetical protein
MNRTYTIKVKQMFEVVVEVDAASRTEALRAVEGNVGIVGTLSNTLDQAVCRVIHSGPHPESTSYAIIKEVQ